MSKVTSIKGASLPQQQQNPGAGATSTKPVPTADGNNKGMVVGAVVYQNMPAQKSASPTNPNGVHQPAGTTPSETASSSANQMVNKTGSVGAAIATDLLASTLANTKEKTPMCLINELARYNKIQHQYTLVDETGPAHKKTFFVKLKLGDEEYSASGASIKKAQHACAAIALEKTAFKHPPPRPPRSYDNNGDFFAAGHIDAGLYPANTITPTVELNALAMKRGEPAAYQPIEPYTPQYYPPPNYDYRGMCHQRYHYPRMPRVFYVKLKVGAREFIGEGATRQAARHSAADKALKILRNLPMPNKDKAMDDETVPSTAAACIQDKENELKSEISLVHEIALKRKMSVNFEVVSISGPPHMRTFITRCLVDNTIETEGEGNGKKISKKRAAEKMLEKLSGLPLQLPSSAVRPKPKIPGNKKKNRNLIKMQKACPEYGVGINPISRLIQIQQAKKEKEPIYTLVEQKGLPRRREFVMQVAVGSHNCTGSGPNKKLAKRNAAESMLQLLGYSRPSPQPVKPAIKLASGSEAIDKKVTFVDQDGTAGRQLVPGVLLMPDAARQQAMANRSMYCNGSGLNRAPGTPIQMGDGTLVSTQTTATIARELLDFGTSPTAESIIKSGTKSGGDTKTVRPKQQLLYLADVLGIQVQFTDFPKANNKNEFLSLVSLSTNPPQVSHGAGITIDDSHDVAALTALKSLSEMGINNMEKKDNVGSGDGPRHIKGEKLANSGDKTPGSNDHSNTVIVQ